MLKCHDVVEQSSNYIDGELGFWNRWQIRLHLFMCVHCRRMIRQLTLTKKVAAIIGKDMLRKKDKSAPCKHE